MEGLNSLLHAERLNPFMHMELKPVISVEILNPASHLEELHSGMRMNYLTKTTRPLSGQPVCRRRFAPGTSSKIKYVCDNSNASGRTMNVTAGRTKKYRSKFVHHKSHFGI
jgi:hypothetical protein